MTMQLGTDKQAPYKSQSHKTLRYQLQIDANLQNIELCLDKTSKQCQ